MKSIGYYPGCSLGGTAAEYDISLRAVVSQLGIELQEVPDWVCCGATSAHAMDHTAALGLASQTLANAHRAGLKQVLAPCAMCYSRLASAGHELLSHPDMAARVAEALHEPDAAFAQVQAVNVLDWLERLPEGLIRGAIKQPLKGLKAACYYGCLLVRPAKITGATNTEAPRSMERIVSLTGAEPVRWPMALECCGGSFALSRKQVVLRQTQRICESARRAGADVLVLACPMCHANLDMRQSEVGMRGDKAIPVVYLTQLLGLALGADRSMLGLGSHFVATEVVVNKLFAPGPVTQGA